MKIMRLLCLLAVAAALVMAAGGVQAADYAPREEVLLVEVAEFAPVDRAALGLYNNIPTLLYHFSNRFYGQVGLSITGPAGVSTTNLLLKGDWKMAGRKELSTHIGGFYLLASNSAGTTSSLGINCGITATIVPEVTLTADIIPLTFIFSGNTTMVSFLTGALGAHYYF